MKTFVVHLRTEEECKFILLELKKNGLTLELPDTFPIYLRISIIDDKGTGEYCQNIEIEDSVIAMTYKKMLNLLHAIEEVRIYACRQYDLYMEHNLSFAIKYVMQGNYKVINPWINFKYGYAINTFAAIHQLGEKLFCDYCNEVLSILHPVWYDMVDNHNMICDDNKTIMDALVYGI